LAYYSEIAFDTGTDEIYPELEGSAGGPAYHFVLKEGLVEDRTWVHRPEQAESLSYRRLWATSSGGSALRAPGDGEGDDAPALEGERDARIEAHPEVKGLPFAPRSADRGRAILGRGRGTPRGDADHGHGRLGEEGDGDRTPSGGGSGSGFGSGSG